MECPNCEEKMDLEYGELDMREWYCEKCEIYVEKYGDKIRTVDISRKEED